MQELWYKTFCKCKQFLIYFSINFVLLSKYYFDNFYTINIYYAIKIKNFKNLV